MKTYQVINPYIVFSVKDGEKERKDYSLKKGDTIELSENDITVRALLARKQIVEVVEKPAEPTGSKKNIVENKNQPVTA